MGSGSDHLNTLRKDAMRNTTHRVKLAVAAGLATAALSVGLVLIAGSGAPAGAAPAHPPLPAKSVIILPPAP